jgi:hypothetical protein
VSKSAPNHFWLSIRREQWMRRTLRKSIPFVWALLAGTLAGACVAGFALFAAHS